MANPAELLAAQFRRWDTNEGTKPFEKRGNLDKKSADEHVRAIQHLAAIRELLDLMDAQGISSAPYRDHWDRWVKAVFAPTARWDQQGASASIKKDDLTMLDGLAVTLGLICQKVDEQQFAQLNQYLDTVQASLRNDETLRQELKAHLIRVVNHVRWCIDNYDTVGDYDLRRAVKDLEAEIVTVAKFSRAKHYWWFAMTKLGLPAFVNVASAPAGDAFTRMITSG